MPPVNDGDDGDDGDGSGIMDRIARALFASPGSPVTAFADQQRVDRLRQCGQLERILKACQLAENRVATEEDPRDETNPAFANVEEIPSRSGVRIARFFKWDSPDPIERGGSDGEGRGGSALSEAVSSLYGAGTNAPWPAGSQKPKRKNRFSESCAREAHQLWACRALSLGCGNHVRDLRDCWSESTSLNRASTLGNNATFEKGEQNHAGSCRNIQLDMSRCVNRRAAELAERVRAAKKQQ